MQSGMSGNHFLHFGTGTGKTKLKISVFGTGTENARNNSRSSGRERENPNFIPVKLDGNGKFESALKPYFSLKTKLFSQIAYFCNENMKFNLI